MGIILPTCSIFFSLLLCIIFYSKKRIKLFENNLYSIMILCILIDGIIASFLQFLVLDGVSTIDYILCDIFNKIDFIMLITYFSCLLSYVIYITNLKKGKKSKNFIKIIGVIDIIAIVILMFLKVEAIESNGNYSIDGLPIYITYIVCISYLIIAFVISLVNVKKLDRRYIPIFVTIALIALAAIIFKLNPYVIILSISFTFVNYIMYFTIENPDMQMLEEIKKSKDLAEQSNTEKAMFLYNTSQEIKRPVNAIEERCTELLDTYEMSDELKEEIRDIKFAAKKLSTTINGVLDMSNSTKNTNIEIKVAKYNTKHLFKELTSIAKVSMTDQNKNLDLRIRISDSIPEYLMGDAIRLKEILLTLINNAIKHTDKGFIEFDVNSVEKSNNCRLIMTVEDSGTGIESSKLQSLFYSNEDEMNEDEMQQVNNTRVSLASVKILVNLIGGTVIVNSELGKGSKFTIVLDQEIAKEEKTTTDIAIESLSSNKKILVVDDEEENLKQVTKLLSKYDVNVETSLWGQECLERIRKHQHFDLILLDEDMPRLNGIKTFEKLKLEENFSVPVVIMVDNSHLEYKDRYLINGFSGILEKPVNKKDIEKLMIKYIKVDE